MKLNKKITYPCFFPACPLIILVFLFVLFLTPALYPGDQQENDKKNFQLELFGGLSTLNLNDFNRLPETDTLLRQYIFDRRLYFLQTNGFLSSWTGSLEGEFEKIKTGVPAQARLKYYFNRSLAVSFGFKYLAAVKNSNPSFNFSRTETSGDQSLDETLYSVYQLSVHGYAPLVGVHLEKNLWKHLTIEGYITGGPIFSRCRYEKQWYSAWYDITSTSSLLLYEENGSLEEEGTGTGISLEGGARINLSLAPRFGVFLGAGYAYQSVKNISGNGKETRGNLVKEWNGEWAIRTEQLTGYWGPETLVFPTNYWPHGSGMYRTGDFELDLSGFQFQVGVFYRF